jgi:hypothetical protein
VVKLGTLLSAFLVLTLLILLAPAMVLTGGSVALSNGEAVTEEIEATFSFNVTSAGAWHTYELGEGGVQPVGNERLALVQYTRQNVELWGAGQRVPGCEVREYTTGSGPVTSTVGNLNGTVTWEWIGNRFNYTYPYTPIYATTTDFGWMWGRARYDEGGGNNFAFVWIADLDCNDDMTAATGKGFMQSVEENGRFGDMGDPIENRSHIMGTLDIALSGGTYTGSFHLRNYPPNEVYDVGALNITGGVLQELTDDIAPQLEVLNVTTDGSMTTRYDEDQPAGFEEIAWGKDPIKTVISSPRLGTGGKMDLTRNTILYLNTSTVGNDTWVHIQGNPACVLYINDTYAVTNNTEGGDGELYEILLLALPYGHLIVNPESPNFFDQAGYTFCPFGTVNGQPTAQTGTYAGAESFADAVIYIEATVGEADQFSYDVSYGLYAHPKIESVTLNQGMPNTTMDVTIAGKYFLRAAGEKSGGINNSGSVDFGDNITVNSYTINNATNPIDNSITVNITIAADAPAGPRVVNVTSCFGYSGGVAGPPYKSGTGVFTVVSGGAVLEGNVGLYRAKSIGDPTWVTGLDVSFFDNSTGVEAGWSPISTTTDAYGNFTVTGIASGTYDIGIKNYTTLSGMVYGKVFASTTNASFGTLIEADCDGNDRDDGSDYAKVLNNYNKRKIQDPTFWANNDLWKADYNRDEKIDGADYASVLNNYNKRGDIFYYTH